MNSRLLKNCCAAELLNGYIIFLLCCSIVFNNLFCGNTTPNEYDYLFPAFPQKGDLKSLAPEGKSHVFPGRAIFDYIDGEGEIVLEYGFIAVKIQEYKIPNTEESMNVDIYAMTEPAEAFGIYSLYRESAGAPIDIGNEGMKAPFQLMFWKGKYFIKITTYRDSQELQDGMEHIARWVAGKITQEGEIPAVVNSLPEKGLDKQSITYFHGQLVVQSKHYIAQENFLNLDPTTAGIFARYRDEKGSRDLFIIWYPSESSAESAEPGIRKLFPNEGSDKSLDLHWFAPKEKSRNILCRKGKIIALFLPLSYDKSSISKSLKDFFLLFPKPPFGKN